MFATLSKSFREQGHHVFMIVEELLNELAVASFCVLVFNLKDEYEKEKKTYHFKTETDKGNGIQPYNKKSEGFHPS